MTVDNKEVDNDEVDSDAQLFTTDLIREGLKFATRTALFQMSTISQRSHLTDSEACIVVARLEGGQTQAEVAQAIGVSQSVISRIWNRFLETGSAGRRPGQDRVDGQQNPMKIVI
ncbi:hypothetical protein TNCV_3692771 [Trichonephila clavipes]|nr:hypothetical protein TNCV_3692771 [Trichonephila clavipes]